MAGVKPKSSRTDPPFQNARVADRSAEYTPAVAAKLLHLRALMIASAKAEEVGPLEEMLTWKVPAYLNSTTKAGTATPTDWKPASPEHQRCQPDLLLLF